MLCGRSTLGYLAVQNLPQGPLCGAQKSVCSFSVASPVPSHHLGSALVGVHVLLHALPCHKWSVFVWAEKLETRWAPAMGTAYSDNWACSAAVRSSGSGTDNNWVRCRRAAAPGILRRSASARTNALYWVMRVSSMRCMACEVQTTQALPCASMCRAWRMART